MHIDKDLVAASATPLVLAILAEGESYGYALLKRVRELSGGELEWTDGMLYPILHRLGRLGYVTTEWRTSPEGRRRRYCAITDAGRAALAEQQRQWIDRHACVGRRVGRLRPDADRLGSGLTDERCGSPDRRVAGIRRARLRPSTVTTSTTWKHTFAIRSPTSAPPVSVAMRRSSLPSSGWATSTPCPASSPASTAVGCGSSSS